MTPVAPSRVQLDDPASMLRWLASKPTSLALGEVDPLEMWSLVALAALARAESASPLRVRLGQESGSAAFAYAVGFEDVVGGPTSQALPGEPGKRSSSNGYCALNPPSPSPTKWPN